MVIGSRFTLAALAVLDPFFRFAFLRAVVLDTALGRPPLAVRLFASKRTSQIPPPCVSGMRQKENPAMPAPRHTLPQLSSGS